MLYTIFIALILVASVLVILAILVQSPKSGMAANFGASNQVMGVRQTSDFLEKFTWTMAIAILALSLLATVVMDGSLVSRSNSEISRDAEAIMQMQSEQTPAIPQVELPVEAAVEGVEAPAEE
ncbi:MAG: preprotein translocase subunit SecG [Rikenellaceae bacterium]